MPINPKQAKFIEGLTSGGMSRAEAYSAAYGQKNLVIARKDACRLMQTNADVRTKIDELLAHGLEAARKRLESEAEASVESVVMLREMGNKEYGVRLQAAKDILDRVGLKAPEKLELSGEVKVSLLDIILERQKQAESE